MISVTVQELNAAFLNFVLVLLHGENGEKKVEECTVVKIRGEKPFQVACRFRSRSALV